MKNDNPWKKSENPKVQVWNYYEFEGGESFFLFRFFSFYWIHFPSDVKSSTEIKAHKLRDRILKLNWGEASLYANKSEAKRFFLLISYFRDVFAHFFSAFCLRHSPAIILFWLGGLKMRKSSALVLWWHEKSSTKVFRL